MKACTKCKHSKAVSDFYGNKKIDSICKICRCETAKIWRLANPVKAKLKDKGRYKKNPEKEKIRHNKWMLLNSEKPEVKAKSLLSKKKWKQNNKGLVNLHESYRRAAKLNATPSWLNESQLEQIKEMYLVASDLSWLSDGGLEVDHIIPLQGDEVSGLHVPWNLQIIPAKINRQKSNKV